MVTSRLPAVGRRLRSPTPALPIRVKSFCSNVPTPNPPTEPTIPQAVVHAFEVFASYLKRPKPDWAKASEHAEELSKVLKNEYVDIAKARVLIAELSKVCGATTLETRLDRLEVTVSTTRKVGVGIATLFAAYLMSIPATVYMNKLDTNGEISKLNGRIEILESVSPSSIPTTKLNVDARVSHEFKLDGPKKQESEAPNPEVP